MINAGIIGCGFVGGALKDLQTTRYQWIDNCKTIGLLLVILGHGRLFPESYQQFIYSFHMPLFFILSGLLYKYKSAKETLLHDIRRLIIPYLLINCICLFAQYGILFLRGGLTWEACYTRFIGIFVVACHTGAFPPVSTPTWFIITLFFSRMLLSLSDNKTYRYLLFVGSVLCFVLMKKIEIDTWLPIDSALMSIPFIVFGIELSPFKAKVIDKRGVFFISCFAIVCFLILFIANNYNGLIDMAWSSYGRNLAIFYVNGFIGSCALMALNKIVPPISSKIEEFCTTISKGALLVIGFNLLFVMAFQTTAEKIIYPHPIHPLIGIIIALVILYFFYWMTKFCQRYFQVILGTK